MVAVAAIGIFMFSTVSGPLIYLAPIVFGMGVCFFWQTMFGFVNTNLPETGALGLNLMGGSGMFAVSIFTLFMGGYYDSIVEEAGNDNLAGREVLQATLIILCILIVAFSGLVIYMRGRNKNNMMAKEVASPQV